MPTITHVGWVDLVIVTAAVLTALTAIGTAVRKVLHVAGLLEDVAQALPVLLGIAGEFAPNGKTLRETIDAQGAQIERNARRRHRAVVDALVDLWDYTHIGHHGVVNALAKVYAGDQTIAALQAKLAAQPQRLDPKRLGP